jgi:hypothetical protein
MRLHTVTITGPDDQSDPDDLVRLATEFPFVEWGILFTRRSSRPTFPSDAWVERLRRRAPEGMRLSGHVCSTWAREVCTGRWPAKLNLERFGRAQLNIARYLTEVASPEGLARCLPPGREYILQVGTSRERGLALAAQLQGLGSTVSVLFDASGGKGISPKSWPSVPAALKCGFAGGLGPDNLAGELRRLERIVGDRVVWIDMQSRVRSEDGAALDLTKVRTCLEVSRPYAQDTAEPAAAGRPRE